MSFELFLLSGAALFAGFIDAVVGGGGLILVPALFAGLPGVHPATLLGINKGTGISGTAVAALQFSRRVDLRWASLGPATLAGLGGAFLGAWTVTLANPDFLRRLLPFILAAVLAYTLARKDMGRHHAPLLQGRGETLAASGIGLLIGFYDGFFGPGTGSFFVFLFVRLLGYDFLHASASAKVLNTATNLAALVLFGLKGHVWWHYVAVMAVANVAGSLLGTRMALRHGAGFVRGVFILVVAALIVKTAMDSF